jgi:hypothetical protein
MTAPALFQKGKQALQGAHRSLVLAPVAASLDLDSHCSNSHANEPRWDYLLRRSDGTGAGVEVHDGADDEAQLLVRKKRWAESVLSTYAPGLDVTRWHWIVPPGASFTFPPTGKGARLVAANRIERPKRRVEQNGL